MVKDFEQRYQQVSTQYNAGELSQIQLQQVESELNAERQKIAEYEQQISQQLAEKREQLYKPILDKVKTVLKDIIDQNVKILKDPVCTITVAELADSSVNFTVRVWVKSPDYWNAYFEVIEQIKLALDENGITIPYPQTVLHTPEASS